MSHLKRPLFSTPQSLNTSTPCKQPRIYDNTQVVRSTKEIKDRRDIKLVKFMASGGLPLRLADNPHFKDFCADLSGKIET